MSTLGNISVYDRQLDFRPVCTMKLHNDLLGNEKNSNFTKTDKKEFSFYLTEMPTLSFGAELGENNGAKLVEKVADYAQGKLFGVSLGEIAQNNNKNGGYVPGLLTGPATFKVVKNARKLSFNLKTRIFFDPGIKKLSSQQYNILLKTLFKLILPSDSEKISFNYIKESTKKFIGGLTDTVSDVTNVDIDFSTAKDVLTGIGSTWGKAAKSIIPGTDVKEIQKEMKDELDKLDADVEKFSESLDKTFNTLLKDFIYKEYVTLSFARNGNTIDVFKNISNSKSSDIKFIVKDFSAVQSNQVYGDTMSPLYIDFEISLESLGVVFKKK